MDSGKIPLRNYHSKHIVSITTDGATVNTGSISGLMTRLASDRGWLVKIPCINHLVELTIKTALKETKFKDIDDFYSSNFNLLINSGKIKSELKLYLNR